MAPSNPPPPLPSSPSVLARLRASTWWPVALRVGAVAVALLVLAWVGRNAAAGPTTASIAAADRDASAGEPAAEAGAPVAPATPAPAATGPAPALATHGHASASDPVYINHASVDELRRLPGVGPKRAEAILVLRQRLGRFQRVEDLLRVKGVGRGAVKKWRPLVRLDTPSPVDGSDGGLR
ncbi:MAG TPA: helix-hairpin-helix domain-containing protein [Labilithrix sp.]|nr:helix-hairpin-helix domain-containing protein [Labilithrix sp.]